VDAARTGELTAYKRDALVNEAAPASMCGRRRMPMRMRRISKSRGTKGF